MWQTARQEPRCIPAFIEQVKDFSYFSRTQNNLSLKKEYIVLTSETEVLNFSSLCNEPLIQLLLNAFSKSKNIHVVFLPRFFEFAKWLTSLMSLLELVFKSIVQLLNVNILSGSGLFTVRRCLLVLLTQPGITGSTVYS